MENTQHITVARRNHIVVPSESAPTKYFISEIFIKPSLAPASGKVQMQSVRNTSFGYAATARDYNIFLFFRAKQLGSYCRIKYLLNLMKAKKINLKSVKRFRQDNHDILDDGCGVLYTLQI